MRAIAPASWGRLPKNQVMRREKLPRADSLEASMASAASSGISLTSDRMPSRNDVPSGNRMAS